MRWISRSYDGLISALAAVGAISLGLTVFAIALDVLLRNIGMRPLQATSALIEYVLLFATMAGAPWLVRNRGHVAIRTLVGTFPPGLRRVVDLGALALCTAILALLSWRAAVIALETAASGALDIRSVALPGWVLYAMLSGGFALMGLEFLRLLLRGEGYDASGAQH